MKAFYIISSIIHLLAALIWLYPIDQILGWIGPAIGVWFLVALAAFVLTGATRERVKDRWP